jgi:hypothetical protein
LKKDRITSRQFSKKFEQVAEDFKKCLTRDPAIAKKIDRVAENFQKRSAPPAPPTGPIHG